MTRVSEEELVGLARNRAKIYALLSTAYSKPPDGRLTELFTNWTRLPEQFPPRMKQGLSKLKAWFERAGNPPSSTLLTKLETEFTRLFRGLSPLYSPPPPYESVYRDGVLYGPCTQEVVRWYHRYQLKGNNNEPPDHISLELDFMRFLCEQEEQAWKNGDGYHYVEEEKSFINEHIMKWVPCFCEKIREFDISDFYIGVADLTEGWLECDRKIILGLQH